MTPKEFQIKHELTDEELETIKFLCVLFNGKVGEIKNVKRK